MMCSNCGKKEVSFIYTESINGVKKELKLCTDCANKLGLVNRTMNMPGLDFSDFLGEFLNEYDDMSLMPSIFSTSKSLKCNECGMDYDEFLNTGKFGCSNCYNVFQSKIEPLLKQLHGDVNYLGKKSNGVKNEAGFNKELGEENKKENINLSEIEKLKSNLKAAIKTENYEEAAKLRDKIKEIESREEK